METPELEVVMEDRELWSLMRMKAEMDEMEQKARRRVIDYLLDFYELDKSDKADTKASEILTIA